MMACPVPVQIVPKRITCDRDAVHKVWRADKDGGPYYVCCKHAPGRKHEPSAHQS